MNPLNRIFITGGTGSLGHALVRRLLAAGSERVCTYSRCEIRQAQMLQEYPQVHAFLGDVRDRERLEEVMPGCDTVIHAAALKRVDSGAVQAGEIDKTNRGGTLNVIKAAERSGIKRVVLVSSDKACMPTNVYGCSKLMAEYLAIGANEETIPRSGMMVSCVRYGNVLGSRGSVVSIWREALGEERPLILTDSRMTRFWLTLDQAVDLIFDCLRIMRGGEIIVPMLPTMRILDLAVALGIEAGVPVVSARQTGLRPGGEKLHERLLSDEEASRALVVDIGRKRIVIPPSHHAWTTEEWQGVGLPVGFIYSSDLAPFGRVSVEEMREWLKGV